MSQLLSSEISLEPPLLENKPTRSFRKFFSTGIKFATMVGILSFLYKKGMLDFTQVRHILTNVPVVVATFGLLVTGCLASVVRWYLLLKGQNISLALREALHLTMIGAFFNTTIPGAVSGDVIKGYYLVRNQPEKRGRIRAFASLLLDRVIGLSALVGISFFAMLLNLNEMLAIPTLKPLCGFITLLTLGLILFYSLMLLEWRAAKKIEGALSKLPYGSLFVKLFEAFKAYEKSRHFIFKGLLISFGIHFCTITAFILLAKSLGSFESIVINRFFFLVPFGLLVTALPITPAGLGTGHAAFLGLFQLVGSRAGADLFTAYISFQIIISLVGGLFYLKYREKKV